MKSAVHTPASSGLYNPGQWDRDSLLAKFAARQELFEALRDDVLAEDPQGIAQHHLVLGGHGMGKTTLLLRIYFEFERAVHRKHFVALAFPEEQNNVDRLSAFWMNCLEALADTLQSEKQTAEVDRVEHALRELRECDPGEEIAVAEAAYAELGAASQRLGRRPLLLVDNLPQILSRLNTREQHTLRALLIAPQSPIIIGAALQLPAEVIRYDAPFYDAFKTHFLSRLTFPEVMGMLCQLGNAGPTPAATDFEAWRPQLEAVYEFTGGNPRLIMGLFEVLARGTRTDTWAFVESLLDEVTPAFKAQVETLPAQAQAVLHALALAGRTATVELLAKLARLPNTTISAQLDRLRHLGWIETASAFDEARRRPSKRQGWRMADPFFRIWYVMRCAPRRERRKVAALASWLERFFALPPEPEMHAEKLSEQPPASPEVRALHASRDSLRLGNQGDAARHLRAALARLSPLADPGDRHWLMAFTAWLGCGQGELLLRLMAESTLPIFQNPWYEAVKAHAFGSIDYFANVPQEARRAAEAVFRRIEELKRTAEAGTMP